MIQAELQTLPAPGRRVEVLRAAGVSPASYYRRLQPRLASVKLAVSRPLTAAEAALCERIRLVLARHSRWGYRKVWGVLKRELAGLPQARIYRLMHRQGWGQPRAGKRPPLKRERFPEVTAADQVWQMDVKAVDLGDWGAYQTISVVDYYSRYWLAGVLADNQRAETLVRTLQLAVEEADRLGGWSGTALVVTDNGPGFKSRLLREYFRSTEGRLRHRRIRRETPQHNGRVERLAGTIDYEIAHLLAGCDPLEAALMLIDFRQEYNHERPHMKLDYAFPIEVYRSPAAVTSTATSTAYTQQRTKELLPFSILTF